MQILNIQIRFGRYIPWLQTFCDFLLLNAVLLVVMLCLNADVDYHHHRRLIVLVANMAMIPSAIYFKRYHGLRTIHTEQMAMVAIKGVIGQAVLMFALMLLLSVSVLPMRFYIEYIVGELLLFPVAWLAQHVVIRRYRRSGRNYRRVIIIGTGDTARRVARNLRIETGYGLRIFGFFGREPDSNFKEKYLGTIDDVAEFVKHNQIDDIYCAGSTVTEEDIKKAIRIADDNLCQFFFIPPLSHHIKRNFSLVPINGSIPALTIHPTNMQLLPNRIIKRAFDIVFSLTVLSFAPVFLPILAYAIKRSSPGPVFFKQTRTGYRGRDFVCYKFRTMRVNAASDSRQATKDDDRKTKLGNFLRHTSIDELPQFWNVLKGDMSVVGPRPHMLAHTEEYRRIINQYMVRHLVKPGITGWAQINGSRGATDELWQMEERVDRDVWYIEHWTFLLDIKIIIRTVTNALRGEENAY